MYAAFARLNYTPWFALAEFVDNSLQSYFANRVALEQTNSKSYQLRVKIDIGENGIAIADNASGIRGAHFSRAFRPAAPPPDTSGLSEFGLGMKAAASWFARVWSVRTSALGEPWERTITFDIPKIVGAKIEKLTPIKQDAPAHVSYTIITLSGLNTVPKTKTISKIREHLTSIYRHYIQDGVLALEFRDELLAYATPKLLIAPYYKEPSGPTLTWKKEIDLDLGGGHRVRGWAGILQRASVTNAGFAIFRRGRLIEGSFGQAYRPERVFGKSNKFRYQRIVGELQIEGFQVSHTKDGVQWDEWETDIVEWLRKHLDESPLRMLDQAENRRVRKKTAASAVGNALIDASNLMEQHISPVADEQIRTPPDDSPIPEKLDSATLVARAETKFELQHANRRWIVAVELADNPDVIPWYEISSQEQKGRDMQLAIRINLGHPFMRRFVSDDGDELTSFVRLCVGLAISEVTARASGAKQVGTVRRNLNQVLRIALSGPVAMEKE